MAVFLFNYMAKKLYDNYFAQPIIFVYFNLNSKKLHIFSILFTVEMFYIFPLGLNIRITWIFQIVQPILRQCLLCSGL